MLCRCHKPDSPDRYLAKVLKNCEDWEFGRKEFEMAQVWASDPELSQHVPGGWEMREIPTLGPVVAMR